MNHTQKRYQFIQRLLYSTGYKLIDWADWDYSILSDIVIRKRKSYKNKRTVNDIIIMADTETSKKHQNATVQMKDGSTKYLPVTNHVVVWTISLRAYGENIVTLRGRKPSEMARCMHKICSSLPGNDTFIYFHNLAYDWVFLRKFIIQEFGTPKEQLNTKSHYPICIQFENGLWLRDSLILAQRGLNKWAKDMNVQHQKAMGDWDYLKIRNQDTDITAEEWHYAENDTLAGVECLEAMLEAMHKDISTIPYTATGIPREAVRNLAREHSWRKEFCKIAPTFEQYIKLTYVYHGGFTHGNRHDIGRLITDEVQCYDFASSYPYCMLAYKMPMSQFSPIEDATIDGILELMDDYAFMFKLVLLRPRLKNDSITMPFLQASKAVKSVNAILDNGRVLCAEYIEIYLSEYDLAIINDQYDFDKYAITECEISVKQYLPRWFTDYIYQCFYNKTMLKGGDPVAYSMSKSIVNSLYGMTVQRCIRENIAEDYATGDYNRVPADPREEYALYMEKKSSILPYFWGCWVTSTAAYNLHQLGACAGEWYYSDTDSCYASFWDEKKVKAYNDQCKQRLKDNGYGPVVRNGREYWLGIAETDGDNDKYTEYKVLGAKRYCGRNKADGKLHITVAGVPKSGAVCLDDDINNFDAGMVFPGTVTGKNTHTYLFIDGISIDENNNEIGDSIDLTPCDYLTDIVELRDWGTIFEEEISIEAYAADDYGN